MKTRMPIFCIAVLFGVGVAGVAEAAPKDLKAYCAKHRDYDRGNEVDVHPQVAAAHATNWRCMDGRVWVCYGGASGRACVPTAIIDADRRKAFNEFCASYPNETLPGSLTVGLASEWQCFGRTPGAVSTVEVDRFGYVKANWRRLP